jgi:hypothetical protein
MVWKVGWPPVRYWTSRQALAEEFIWRAPQAPGVFEQITLHLSARVRRDVVAKGRTLAWHVARDHICQQPPNGQWLTQWAGRGSPAPSLAATFGISQDVCAQSGLRLVAARRSSVRTT